MHHSTGKQSIHDEEFWSPGHPVCEEERRRESTQNTTRIRSRPISTSVILVLTVCSHRKRLEMGRSEGEPTTISCVSFCSVKLFSLYGFFHANIEFFTSG